MLHPKIRLPIWLAIALPLGAYAYRSAVMRGGDWRPDLPWDIVLFLALAALIGLVAWARFVTAQRDEAEHAERNEAPPT